MITFPFIEFETENLGIVKRPFAVVQFINSGKRELIPLLIDSGADITVISNTIGLSLGLRLKEDEKFLHLGGVISGFPVVLYERNE